MYKLDMPVTRQCSDKGEWYWGGRFCIPHEVKLSETGDLLVDIPQEFTESIHKTIPWNYLHSYLLRLNHCFSSLSLFRS